MARLFFAIWPGPAASADLASVGESLASLAGGKPVPAGKIHMTLAFLGTLDHDRAASAAAVASTVKGAGILMSIDAVGSFRGARVGWAAASQPDAELARLQARLAGQLRLAGFDLEERAFTPHASLVRKINKPIERAPMAPIEWRSRALTLVESAGTGRYEVLESWGLT